ncbi:hypothetical protein SMAC4_13814 [Sordaria macrospora]|uniref:uncharacterized protein n=1 Tax=Sordaria macrospora TaxID=5147 RepID=UPI002B2A7E9E|nr:hypothetical protein SMAC4_13814 [Sordaria macrospora]
MPSVLRSNQSVKIGASPILLQTRSVSWAQKNYGTLRLIFSRHSKSSPLPVFFLRIRAVAPFSTMC